jgi:hypothetical protein
LRHAKSFGERISPSDDELTVLRRLREDTRGMAHRGTGCTHRTRRNGVATKATASAGAVKAFRTARPEKPQLGTSPSDLASARNRLRFGGARRVRSSRPGSGSTTGCQRWPGAEGGQKWDSCFQRTLLIGFEPRHATPRHATPRHATRHGPARHATIDAFTQYSHFAFPTYTRTEGAPQALALPPVSPKG